MRRRPPLAALLAACIALVAPQAARAAEVWAASPGEKIFPHSTRPAEAPAAAEVAAARDEYEGVQVVIRSDAPLTVEPRVTDLRGPGVIPASAVRLYRVGYVQLRTPSTGVDRLEGDGRYPDPLIPVTGPVTVPAGETTALYALVHVPAGAAPGRYEGALDLGQAGAVPLAVEVAPVTASRDRYQMVVRLNQISLARALGVEERDPRLVEGVMTRLLPMLRERGVSPGKAPYTTPKVDPPTWAVDYSNSPLESGGLAREEHLRTYLGMGFPRVEVPFLPNFPNAGGEDRAYLANAKRRTAAEGFGRAFAGAAGRTFALPVDEPSARTYAQLNRAAAQLDAASPRIPVLVTEAPHPEALRAIGSSVDIWAPPIWDLFKVPRGVARVRAQGKGLWWYTYGSDTQRYTPNLLIDKPTTEPRMMGWLAAREGVQGFFYWGLNNWGGKAFRSPWDDPWYLSHTTAPDRCAPGGRRVGGNGEASLLYPTGDPRDPVYGSLRLEALRDGAEDYSVLEQLRAADPGFYRRVLAGVATPYTGRSDDGGKVGCSDDGRPAYLPVVETDPAAVDGLRRAVLARLSARPLPTLRGRVVLGGGARPKGRRGDARAGAPVAGATVRFGAFSTTTDRDGRWVLRDVSPTPGRLTVSRDPVGRVDARRVTVDAATLAQPGPVEVATPPLPLRLSVPVIRKGGLTRFSGRIRPARARTRGQVVTMTLGRRYRRNGLEVRYRGGVSPSVDARYPPGRASARLRDWRRYGQLEFTAEVLRRPPGDQAFHLIVTPGGHYRNATKVAVGNRRQLVRLPLRGMRGMGNVAYLRFGVQSAVPKPWRGGHDLRVVLRVSDLRLVR